MPRLSLQQTNFTAGELSPRLYGRTDVDKYSNAAKFMENAHPLVHGGATRRAGTRFAQETKTSSKKSRLVEFIYSKDLAYMLEFGDFYMRAYSPNGVYLGVEVVTPYSETMLADLDYVQGADTMFLLHPQVTPYRVRRFTNTNWDVSAAPFTTTPFDEIGYTFATTITLSALSGVITATAAAAVFQPADVGRYFTSIGGFGIVTGYISTTVVQVTTTNPFVSTSITSGNWNLDSSPQATCTPSAVGPVGTGITLTLGTAGWKTTDVGSFVRINSGVCKITGFTSNLIVNATVVSVLANTTGAPALSWSLEPPVWNATNGYPRTGTLHEQRLWCAGTTKQPQTIWGSRTGLYYDFTKGVNDSDGCSFTISSDEVNPISYLASNRTLLIHTYGGELSMAGGQEKPITPTNVQVKPQTSYGSKIVRPLLIGRESIFVQRSGRKVRAMSYQFQVDGYQAPDLTILAEHITTSGVVSMAYQQDPDQLLWVVLADGTLVSCTLDRDQGVNGWARHYTSGAVESVACIPTGTQDQLWAIVRRTVNGVTKRYVEYFDNTLAPIYPAATDPLAFPPITQPLVYGCTTDCSTLVDNVSGQSTFTGLSYLEGKTVDVVADGLPMPQQVVTGGSITIGRTSKRTLIGLHFKSTITLLTPEVSGGTGTAQGNSMHTGELTMRFYNTLGAKVLDGYGNSQEVPFRHFGTGVLDQPPPVYSGLLRVEMLGWERGRSELSIVQDQPLPMQLLSAVRKITIND